jgi:hypothetical protein
MFESLIPRGKMGRPEASSLVSDNKLDAACFPQIR